MTLMSSPGSLKTTWRRSTLACGLAGLLVLAACDKGPDREAIAAQLKNDAETQLQIMAGNADHKVVSHSGVTVTPEADDRYVVAIEGLRFAPDAEGYLDFGTLSYVAKPKDEQSYEVSELKIAPEIPFKGADGTQKGKLALVTKSFSGLWSRELATLRKIDVELADIVATDDRGGDLRLAAAKASGELTDKGGGVYDSAFVATLTGLQVKESGGDGLFSVGEILADGRYDSIKIAEFQAAMKKYQELMLKQVAAVETAGQGAAASGGQAPALTAEEQKALSDSVNAMAAAIKGAVFKIGFKEIGYTEAGVTPFSVAQLNLGSAFDGINQDKASLSFDVAHQGLAINAPEASGPLAKAVLPKQGNLGLKVTEIPSKELTKVLADNLPGIFSADGAMAEANAMAMLVALQAVLQTSGAKIEVTPSAVTAEMTEVKADGAFSVTPQSVMGAAGTLNIAWTGLDDVMALAQANPADPSSSDVIGVVSMLLQFANRESGADGKPVDKFKIDVKETGELLVNDKPM